MGTGECVDGCLSALSRRKDIPFHMIVNSAPAKCCAWPVVVPAGAFVRAGAGRRGVGGLIGAFCVRFTPVSFPLSGKERRLAMCCVSIPPWVGIALVRSRMSCGYRTLWVHFGLVRFFAAIPTEDGETRDTRNGVGGAAQVRFCVNLLALPCFPRGERWGCAPQTAPKSLRLSGLSSLGSRRRCVFAQPCNNRYL